MGGGFKGALRRDDAKERQRMAKRAPRIGQMNSTASSAISRSYPRAAEPGGSLRLQRR